MASSTTTKKFCVKCDGTKPSGNLFTCSGCQQMFCVRHVEEHQRDLAVDFDQVIQEHDFIQEETTQIEESHTFAAEIDEWERRSIQIIQETAERIRLDAAQLQEKTRNLIKQESSALATDLIKAKEEETYTEAELNAWKAKLKEIRKSLDSFKKIGVIEEKQVPIRWIRLQDNANSLHPMHGEPRMPETKDPSALPKRTIRSHPSNDVRRSGSRENFGRPAECKQQ